MILTLLKNPLTFQLMASAGVLFAVLGSLIPALAYRGKQGQAYSPLNHFISELGEVGVSKLAWVFNLGLILSGLCLLPASLSFGLMLPGFIAKLGLLAGGVTALGLGFVGVFPMNKLKPHAAAAMTFFRAGLAMVLSFSLAIALQDAYTMLLPRAYALAGLPAILAFASFLFLMAKAAQPTADALNPLEAARPKVWVMPILEWAIFFGIVAWFLVIALGL